MTPERTTGEWSIVARQQEAIAHVGQLGLRGVGFDALLAETMKVLAAHLRADAAMLFELSADWRTFAVRGVVIDGYTVTGDLLGEVVVPSGTDSLPGYTVLQGEVVSSPRLLADERFRASAPDFDMRCRSGVAAPVGWGQRPWGVVAGYANEERTWTADDLHFVHSIANTLGLAIYRHEAEAALVDSSARLEMSLVAGGLGSWEWEFVDNTVQLSSQAADVLGLGDQAMTVSAERFLEIVHPDDRVALRGRSYEGVETTGDHHAVYRIIRTDDGRIRWMESWGRTRGEKSGPSRLVGVLGDITDRRMAEETKEALLAAEQRARVEAEQVRERLTLLSELSDRVMSTLDPDTVVRSFPHFCVPQIADVCLVDLIDDTGVLVEAAAAAVSPEALADVRELRRRRAELDGVGGVWSERHVATTGERVLVPRLTDEQMQRAATDAEHLALFRRFDPRSGIVIPLVARGRVVGVVSVISTGASERIYSDDDLALVQEMADRVALAHDNGRLFASRNRVARTLQESLLPPTLPTVPGLDLAARYQVAEIDFEIGGDFYDVIEMGDRAWGAVVGDVCGRGPEAAALTGLMRHSVRTAVVRERLPSRVLGQTNDAVLDQIDDARFCTAAYLRLELGEPGGDVTVLASSAGHPRPLLLRADGRAEAVPAQGLLLGVVPSLDLVDIERTLAPGDAIVLYTDGLIEARRGDEQFGEEGLLEALASLAGRSSDDIAAGVMDRVEAFAEGASDDRAVLVVRVEPTPAPVPAH
jgi:PAS domain S-box-containing protein